MTAAAPEAEFCPEVLFAKHQLVTEIGPEGQAALCSTEFRVDHLHPEVGCVAEDLLVRAGSKRREAPGSRLVPLVAETSACPAILLEVCAALAGAIAATEFVRDVVGVGARRIGWPSELFRGEATLSRTEADR